MWKYLILNTLWFSILFFVHFFGSRKDQLAILVMVLAIAFWLAAKGLMDPLAWFYYLAFSLLVFYGSRHFRQWAFDRLFSLREEIRSATQNLEHVQALLGEKTASTRALEVKADEIVEFYEQIKEMSKSLDGYETFVIFCEALSEYFRFDAVKLAFFGDRPDSSHPEEVYQLHGRDFKGGSFDREAVLKDRKRILGEVFPFDEKIYATVLNERRAIGLEESKDAFFEKKEARRDFAAYPVVIHDRIFAVLTLVGLETRADTLLFILVERFIAELQRVKLYQSIQKLAITDGLTGVYVRHHLMERLEGEMDRSKRFALKLSFLMIDIDHFKHFNDEYGHLVGDVVLRQVAQTIKKNIREVDFVGRYGGEEFGVGLIETDEATAFLVAERIRRAVMDATFFAYDERLQVKVSVGAATLSLSAGTTRTLVDAADAAMYQAKRLGRNRVCVSA